MKQYLDTLKLIKEKGTHKPAARAGMPGSTSLFGHQTRYEDIRMNFPAVTTKKLYWNGIVTELLWFLRGDTNIKYLVDNGANFWNEDAYNYYTKLCKQYSVIPVDFKEFIEEVKAGNFEFSELNNHCGYRMGDCGYQYGKVWRHWEGETEMCRFSTQSLKTEIEYRYQKIDQIARVMKSLQETPESRRHIVTAVDPAHDTELALYWCHSMFQFNCRPLTLEQRFKYWFDNSKPNRDVVDAFDRLENSEQLRFLNDHDIPKYYLDCQLYQRSADVFLGVPFNIASYALLTCIFAYICDMIPGDFIHTFGDVHIYDNHMDAVNEQLTREPKALPKLSIDLDAVRIINKYKEGKTDFDTMIHSLEPKHFLLYQYECHPTIKAELSTGLKKII